MKRIDPPVDFESRTAALAAIEPTVARLVAEHLRKRRLWFPADFFESTTPAEMAECARGVSDPVRVALALNLLTEEGLPHFHRLITSAFGSDGSWKQWSFIWTAEEERHGCVIRDYARDARLFRQGQLDRLQHAYQETGFSPVWVNDPYKTLVYVTIQERATWMSHRNTGRVGGGDDPLLAEILTRIAAEEARHHVFYRETFRAVLDVDPDAALTAAAFILPAIEMPGVGIPGFRDMAFVAWREGIYGPRDYLAIVKELIGEWRIGERTGLGESGRRAQDAIGELPRRLERVAERAESRVGRKSCNFPFLERPALEVA